MLSNPGNSSGTSPALQYTPRTNASSRRTRIKVEEQLLLKFYPNDYPSYAEKTYIGIPFIPNTTTHAKTN
jgi:hypothetical protein